MPLLFLFLFYIVIIFCWPEGVAYDIAHWLFIANSELLWLLWSSVKAGDGAALWHSWHSSVFSLVAWILQQWSEEVCSALTPNGYTVIFFFLLDCKSSWICRWPSRWPSCLKASKVIHFLKCLRTKSWDSKRGKKRLNGQTARQSVSVSTREVVSRMDSKLGPHLLPAESPDWEEQKD